MKENRGTCDEDDDEKDSEDSDAGAADDDLPVM